jgi:hypothetical protein
MSKRTQVPRAGHSENRAHEHSTAARTTGAFFAQAAISFAVSLTVTIIGIGYLHDSNKTSSEIADQ